jgi:hypothetical protein
MLRGRPACRAEGSKGVGDDAARAEHRQRDDGDAVLYQIYWIILQFGRRF